MALRDVDRRNFRRNLSGQGTAIRGGISARTPVYHSSPVEPRVRMPAYAADAISDPIDMVEIAPRRFVDGESDLRDREPLRGPRNAFESLAMEDMGREMLGGVGAKALTGLGMTALAGAPATAALTPGLAISALTDAAKHGIATHRVGSVYGPGLDDISREDYDTIAGTARGVEDPTEVYSPEEMTAYDQTRQALSARSELLGRTETPEMASSLTKAGLALADVPVPKPLGYLPNIVGLPSLLYADVTPPQPTQTVGDGGGVGPDPNAGRPGIMGTDLAMDTPHGVGHFGSYDPGLVKVASPYRNLYAEAIADRNAQLAGERQAVAMGAEPTVGFDQGIQSNIGRVHGGPVSVGGGDMRGRDGGGDYGGGRSAPGGSGPSTGQGGYW